MRHRALEKLNANKVETIAPSVSLDPELDCDQQLSVGATALCASILNANGMLKNVGTVLDNNPELTMACINLAMHSAITTDKTYLADKESTQQKFIGYGCRSSPRASEFFQRIGNEQTLSLKMAKACATHLEDEYLPLMELELIAILKISVLRPSARKKMVRMALKSTFRW